MDQRSDSLSKLGNAVSDLTSLLNKMQLQLTDLSNAVKLLPTPAAAPPPAVGGSPSAAAAPAAPPISATDLYNNADRDEHGGHLDLALQEFTDYLRYYGDTPQAAAAQFYIGYIHYGQATSSGTKEDFQTAAQDFQNVIEKYPDDAKRVPEAMYYKGLSLQHMSRRDDASRLYRDLIQQFPKDDNAKNACKQLQGFGLRCPTAAPAKAASKKKG
jgi:TolA-binding protein